MSKALIAKVPGGPEVLEWVSLDPGAPGSGQVLLRQTAIGVNFIDIYYRSGLYAWPETPLVIGAEAAGVIEAVGPDVSGLAIGDRVAYCTSTGAYRQSRVVAADRLVKLPDTISDQQAASILLKGLTAQYLVTGSFRVEPGQTILVHAAAGGVGLLLGQWISALGATVIGTVSTPEKAELALAHGYHHVINYRTEDFVARVREITGGAGCHAVYDSVGKDTWRGSLQSLRPLGSFVNFGQSSGPITDFKMSDLAAGSYSAIRPVLFHYVSDSAVLAERAKDLFERLESGRLKSDIAATFDLKDASEAHRRLEGRSSTGSMILIP